MKKGILLSFFAAFGAIVVYSYNTGPAFFAGIDGTTAKGGAGGCNNGSCHASANADVTVVELDSAGIPVTSYHPGMAYTVKVSSSNSTANSWPRFGFQMAVVKLVGSGTASATDAGTWGTLPANVHSTVLTETIIEHSSPILATTGNGGNGTTYVESIPWTAPASGTGSVVVYGVINEVNYDGTNGGDGYKVASSVTISEAVPAAVASVQIAITSGSNPTCANSSLTFTATPTNGGTAPTYQWLVNGNNVGTGATFITSSLISGQTVTCVMTSNLGGVTGNPATSNAITVTVNPTVTPTVSITSNDTSICPNQSVTFTATPTNGGTTPTYQWKKNGTAIAGATASTYVTTTLINNDVITVVMTSNAACASPDSAVSGAITMVVGTTVVPVVSIVSTDTTICPNQSVTFTANPTNGGASPSYQWRKNGTPIGGATNSTYTSTTLANNDVITVVMVSNAQCASPAAATSHAITMVVGTAVVPSVTVHPSATSICPNQTVNFTSTPINGGASPTYRWKKNGIAISGATLSTYSSSSLVNNDVITLLMTSNANCATPDTAISSSVTITVGTTVVPAINITVTDSNLCANQSATFTATPTNGGAGPTYQWLRNDTAVTGATNATFNVATPNDGEVISVVLTSNANCALPSTATSSAIRLHVTTPLTPAVSIAAAGGDSICANQNTTITATPVNGGSNPTYVWAKNGTIINGVTGATYSTTTLVNNDVISCTMTSNAGCVTTTTVSAFPITFNIGSTVTPSISIYAGEGNSNCAGQPATITAYVVGGGSAPTYHWYLDNVLVVGDDSASYTSSSFANNDSLKCVLISNSACATNLIDTSNSVTINITPTVTPTVSLTHSGTSICSDQSVTVTATPTNGGITPTYDFSVNGVSVQNGVSATYTATNLHNSDVITCVLSSNALCASPVTATTGSITVTVKPVATSSISQTICHGDTFLGRTATGVYYDTAQGANGCDSIRTLHLTVNPVTTSNISQTICQGQIYLGHSATGVFNDTLSGSLGCDSIRTLHLTVNPVATSTIFHSICPGQSYLGHNTSGTYIDTLTAANTCDSIRTLHLTVSNITFDTLVHAICHGDSIVFSGVTYTQAGSYTDTFSSVGGCDSVVTLALTVNALPVVSLSWDTLIAGNYLGSRLAGGAYWCHGWYPDSIFLIGGIPTGGTFNGHGVSSNVFYGQVAYNNFGAKDTITYTYTDSNGCMASAQDSISLEICEGITTINPNNLFTIYPNPANDYVMIDFDAGYTGSIIAVKDVTGRSVLQTRLATSPQQIATGDLPAGIYVVTLNNNGQVEAKLFVKE